MERITVSTTLPSQPTIVLKILLGQSARICCRTIHMHLYVNRAPVESDEEEGWLTLLRVPRADPMPR